MITGAGEVAVVGGALLVAIGLAHTRVHVEHDAVQRTAAVPPIVSDDDVGRSFRKLLHSNASCQERQLPHEEFCGAASGRVLVDHGAYMIAADEAASLLASVDPAKSE